MLNKCNIRTGRKNDLYFHLNSRWRSSSFNWQRAMEEPSIWLSLIMCKYSRMLITYCLLTKLKQNSVRDTSYIYMCNNPSDWIDPLVILIKHSTFTGFMDSWCRNPVQDVHIHASCLFCMKQSDVSRLIKLDLTPSFFLSHIWEFCVSFFFPKWTFIVSVMPYSSLSYVVCNEATGSALRTAPAVD